MFLGKLHTGTSAPLQFFGLQHRIGHPNKLRDEIIASEQNTGDPHSPFYRGQFSKLYNEGSISFHDLPAEYRRSLNSNEPDDYRKSHQFNKVRQHYENEIERSEIILGPDHWLPQVLKRELVDIFDAEGLYNEAERSALEILEANKKLGMSHPKTLQSMVTVAVTLASKDQWKDAEQKLKFVFQETLRGPQATHLRTLDLAMCQLAKIYLYQGKWKKSQELCNEALVVCKQQLGETHPITLVLMATLAETYGKKGKWSETITILEDAWDKSKRVLGETHPETLGIVSMANQATIYHERGQWNEAENFFGRVDDFVGRETSFYTGNEDLNETDPDLLLQLKSCLATTYHNQERIKEAHDLETEVLSRREKLDNMRLSHMTPLAEAGRSFEAL
ncbi:hypothetical protein BDD12DRAFT_808159 [Trichophaea hybrida]|nr:hypothetical protein BDD12DRAFT_808159 [Trichophaea hybrida]